MTKKQTKKIWQPKNLAEIFFVNGEKYKNKNALAYKKGHRYHKLTYGELRDEIVRAALALKKLGIEKGDCVLIASENRPEWVIVDVAIMSIGAISVPIHKNLAPSQVECILNETKPVLAFFSDEVALKTIGDGKKKIKHLVSFEKLPELKVLFFEFLMNEVKLTDTAIKKVQKEALLIKADTIMTVVYTSGTTGKPKGAQLTHKNIVFVVSSFEEKLSFVSNDIFFSILPLSHIFERVAGNFMPFLVGASIEYCVDIANFSSDIKKVKPTVILAVPRLFEKVYDQVYSKVGEKLITKTLFNLAMNYEKTNGLMANLFDRILFQRIRDNLGGNIRLCIAGGAATNPDILRFFNKIGIALVEGYGLTETASALSANDPVNNRISTVGQPINGLDVKIAGDGEILIKGDSVTLGYLNPTDDIGAFTKDGFFKTGDLGEIDDDGYIKIIGRKKDVQVLTTGEKVVPVVIENALTSSSYIEQALAIGNGYKHIAAIIVPNFEHVSERLNIDKKEVCDDKELRSLLDREIGEAVRDLPKIQQVKKYIIAREPFSIGNNQMTASLKPRRQEIIKAYAREIKKLYHK
ncbi:MAG: AMP-dependent synthetase/ligase [Candidatus Nanosyncoccaceae bacterium]|jgi:long-chain acyl-CoA synthetase